ncbi:MAG: CaiB/BaiF CoA-transferase family protein [Gammaproteobacteria bacterium]
MPAPTNTIHAAPLAGITVVSIEQAIAAPLCTRQLAELGARVIKVERRDTGDFARHYDQRVKGQCSHFVWTNRSKESFTLDLKHARAAEIMQRLLPVADVLVQNLAPSAAHRLGLGFAQLHPRFPQLILCNISGYGNEGPYSEKKAYDLLVQAEAGFLSVTGTAQTMVKSGISIADIAAGMQAQAAILAALIQRGKTGEGSCIDISMLESMVEWMGFPLYYAFDGAQPPARSGADHASIYPYGAFTAADGEVIMVGLQNEREWRDFCDKVLDLPELVNDPRFRDNSSRSANREQLRELIQQKFAGDSAEVLCRRLDQAMIAWADVNDMSAVWNHRQLKALQRQVEVPTPGGPVPAFRPPGNNSSFEPVLGAVPALGEHTYAILDELGFSETEKQELSQQQVV